MSARLAWLALLVLALGCAVEPLNRTGSVRAGNAGADSCPQGFVARWGRCCPSASTPAECPATLERDTTGTMYEPQGCSCPAGTEARGYACCPTGPVGDAGTACTPGAVQPMTGCVCPSNYELRFGRCCPRDAGPECPGGEIGSPCEVNEDCRLPIGSRFGLQPFCVRTRETDSIRVPNGYCSVYDCMTDADCGPGSSCLDFFGFYRICVRSCAFPPGATSASCPLTGDQLSCHQIRALGREFRFCFPDCTRDPNVCGGEGRCFPDLRYCAMPCSVRADDTRCVLNGYARCNTERGHCEY